MERGARQLSEIIAENTALQIHQCGAYTRTAASSDGVIPTGVSVAEVLAD